MKKIKCIYQCDMLIVHVGDISFTIRCYDIIDEHRMVDELVRNVLSYSDLTVDEYITLIFELSNMIKEFNLHILKE